MKRIISLVLIAVLALGLCSCGKSKEPNEILIDYIIKNGESVSDKHFISFQDYFLSDYQTYFIVYDKTLDQISFEYYEADFYLEEPQETNKDIKESIKINYNTDVVKCYSITDRGVIYEGSGNLSKETFGEYSSDQLSNLNISGKYEQSISIMKQSFSVMTMTLLNKVGLEFKNLEIGINLQDLGYVYFD